MDSEKCVKCGVGLKKDHNGYACTNAKCSKYGEYQIYHKGLRPEDTGEIILPLNNTVFLKVESMFLNGKIGLRDIFESGS